MLAWQDELEKWTLTELTIYLHLQIESIRKIKYNLKKANPNIFNVHQYLIGDNKTKDGLPFFRGEFYFKDSKDGMDTSYNGLIWTSDFELNRLRLSEHWYIESTFDLVLPRYIYTNN